MPVSPEHDRSQSASNAPIPGEQPPVVAAFSPNSSTHSPTLAKQRSTILVHQKSPLLIATPPQITRSLAYSHPFLLPLNRLAGLLSWTTGDPWESFLLVASFWFTVLYGDNVLRWVGPLVLAALLILGMYTRRYSPLSSTGWVNPSSKPHTRKESDGSVRHHKSLDEIVASLQLFTSRCNILLDPFLRLTDFLSTQKTATAATTRPALTALFIRLLFVTPVWYALTLPPFYFVTTRRVVLTFGTLALSWHSRPARVSRTILWRSRTIRRAVATVTGLALPDNSHPAEKRAKHPKGVPRTANDIAASLASRRARREGKTADDTADTVGIRFTFSLYENQRRWIGIGWTYSMLAYERAAWTDEQLNPVPPKEKYKLPEVEGGMARWQWVPGSRWEVGDGGDDDEASGKPNDASKLRKRAVSTASRKSNASSKTDTTESTDDDRDRESRAWIYYDNKWLNGRRGVDGWGRYTRRRRWVRDAELVEVLQAEKQDQPRTSLDVADKPSSDKNSKRAGDGDKTPQPGTPHLRPSTPTKESRSPMLTPTSTVDSADDADAHSHHSRSRRSWFLRRKQSPSPSRVGSERNRTPRSRRGSLESQASTATAGTAGSTAADAIESGAVDDAASVMTMNSRHKAKRSGGSASSGRRDDSEDDGYVPLRFRGRESGVGDWGVGEDVGMELG